MTDSEVLDKLKEIFKTALPNFNGIDNISMNDRLIEDLGMTSITFVYMAFVIEKEFHIELSGINFKTFKTVHDVINYILNK